MINMLKTAGKSILKNRTRSLLTSLGIIIGISSVIVLVAIGEGSRVQIEGEINSLGTNLLMVRPGGRRSGGVSLGAGSMNSLTFDDVEKIKSKSSLIKLASPVVTSNEQIVGGSGNWNTRIYGVSPEYFEIRDWEIEQGSFFTDKDLKGKKKVALLGKTVADELFPDQDPTGQKIRIRNIPFKVVGTLKGKGQSGMGQDQDDMILAPATTVLYRLKGGRNIDMINLSSITMDDTYKAEEEVASILRDSHRLSAGQEDDFDIRNQAEILDTMNEVTGVITTLLGSIAGVSLLVGGIGIMNIMLVSVTERTREIGIRLSVGARKSDIMIQFLVEAIVLSLVGGLIGVLLALAITGILNAYSSINAVIQMKIILISFLFSGAVGVFFGYYPARKASSLNPIDALRYE